MNMHEPRHPGTSGPPTLPTSSPSNGAPSASPVPSRSASRSWLTGGALALLFAVAAIVGVNLVLGTSPGRAAEPSTTSATSEPGTSSRGVQRHGVGGEITAIDGSTITISSMGRKAKGESSGAASEKVTYTVNTTSSTTFSKVADGTVGDLSSGDVVVVNGTTSNGTVAAKGIHQLDQLPEQAPNGTEGTARRRRPIRAQRVTLGTITSVSGSTIIVKTVKGTSVKVTSTSDTRVSVMEKTSLSDLAKGVRIRANGTVSGTTIAATAVIEGPAHGPRAGGPGACDDPGMEAPEGAPAPDDAPAPDGAPVPNGSAPSTTQSS